MRGTNLEDCQGHLVPTSHIPSVALLYILLTNFIFRVSDTHVATRVKDWNTIKMIDSALCGISWSTKKRDNTFIRVAWYVRELCAGQWTPMKVTKPFIRTMFARAYLCVRMIFTLDELYCSLYFYWRMSCSGINAHTASGVQITSSIGLHFMARLELRLRSTWMSQSGDTEHKVQVASLHKISKGRLFEPLGFIGPQPSGKYRLRLLSRRASIQLLQPYRRWSKYLGWHRTFNQSCFECLSGPSRSVEVLLIHDKNKSTLYMLSQERTHHLHRFLVITQAE